MRHDEIAPGAGRTPPVCSADDRGTRVAGVRQDLRETSVLVQVESACTMGRAKSQQSDEHGERKALPGVNVRVQVGWILGRGGCCARRGR